MKENKSQLQNTNIAHSKNVKHNMIAYEVGEIRSRKNKMLLGKAW